MNKSDTPTLAPQPGLPAPAASWHDRKGLVQIGLLAVLLLVPLAAYFLGHIYYVNLASRITLVAMAAVGLNLAIGYGGMVSFGHAAYFGLGGYVAGISAYHAFDFTPVIGWPVALPGSDSMLAIWLAAILLCGLLALVIGAISLRTTGVYFIMITLAFAQMIYYFANSWPTYGGEDGLPIYLRNSLPIIDTNDALTFFLICFGGLVLSLALTSRIMKSRFGAALTMARLNDTRLATAGIAPYPIRLVAFVISAMITGLAGALYADLNGFVSPTMLSWHMSGELMVIVILGGVGRLYGPLAGAILFVMMETLLGGLTEYWKLFLGLVLLFVVLFAKHGVMGWLAGRERHE
ncbi:MAG: branched-chain amino acid ABC transporter permease [Halomonas sp.]|jgi:branched-chain amino acid transport system permease protein|uniref:Branched-chain amino acid ABC transporter permease n=1 Tax=Billgrantia tianxiuensis TaxID=2497861 RepID=A0A6I6SJT0_9GAMM|nr:MULTISPECIES: branched-chain amino acid ABC transporter permease [Halomonas]MCE8034238.1 branched-chain amino acid ABC transporter permease [Halomonas sp. MCCC 1A11057]MDX5433913.1 branched-chain amino acid ABC transporter permease [Halomonas sp.]QHC50948.1 branched-chain amino acid ABC transporter permease [Halomonas tianxiuensis]